MPERLTRKNGSGTYRVPMVTQGELDLKWQQGELNVFGELANRLPDLSLPDLPHFVPLHWPVWPPHWLLLPLRLPFLPPGWLRLLRCWQIPPLCWPPLPLSPLLSLRFRLPPPHFLLSPQSMV